MNIKLLSICIIIAVAKIDASITPTSTAYLVTAHLNNPQQLITKQDPPKTAQLKTVLSHVSASYPSSLENKVNTIVAQSVVDVLIAAENTALGPVSKLHAVKALEKKEVTFLKKEITKAEEIIENTASQDISKLCASWGISCPAWLCVADDARQD